MTEERENIPLVYICWKAPSTGTIGRGREPISNEAAKAWIKLQEQDGSNMEYWTEYVTTGDNNGWKKD